MLQYCFQGALRDTQLDRRATAKQKLVNSLDDNQNTAVWDGLSVWDSEG